MMMPEAPEQQEDERGDPVAFVQLVTSGANLAEQMDEEQLREIGRDCKRDYEADRESMADWLERMEKAINLAKLVKDEKSYPFDKASNIKYPLVTSAALQFNARAYPAIVPGDSVVKVKTFGKDANGAKAARADRVGTFMSWQMMNQVEEWEQDTDRLLLQLSIVGDMFRKVWSDGERPQTRLVEPGRFIVNANCGSLEKAPRTTEEISLYPYEVQEREADSRFMPLDYTDDDEDTQKPLEFIEQHCRLDLDEDGYPEPYIVTVECEQDRVVRIVADFRPEDVKFRMEQVAQPAIVQGQYGPMQIMQMQEVPVGIERIKRRSYFVHYQFMPGVDGKFWGIGLGVILGDISSGINSTFNMLMDAGHYASLGGGFIGSEFRIKGGAQRMRPGEWKQVQTSGQDVRASLVPATYPGPDATLFQMLGLLIDAGKEVASVKDVMTGETKTNMQPTTVMALIEQGMKVFTASYKRIFRSLKKEFRLIALINADTLDPQTYNAFLDEEEPADPAQDFSAVDMDICPVADPNSVTRMQEMAKAQLLMDMAQQGLVNPQEASARVLEAAAIDDREALAPQQDPMAAQMAQFMAQSEMEMRTADLAQKRADLFLTAAKIESEQASAVKDMTDAEEKAKANQLTAIRIMLEEIGRDMDRSIAGSRRGMAGAPGNGGNAGNAGIAAPRPDASGL